MFVANKQGVAEAGGGDHRRSANLAFNQRVGDERGGMHDRRGDLGRTNTRLRQQLGHPGAYGVERSRRRGQRLIHHDAPRCGVEQHHVGKRPTDVDSQSPISGHRAL